jgi:hypothetical protein
VQLKLTYIFADGSEVNLVSLRKVELPSFAPTLDWMVWSAVAETLGTAAQLNIASIDPDRDPDSIARGRAEEQAERRRWFAGEDQQSAILRVDGTDVPAIKLERDGATAVGADVGQLLVTISSRSRLPDGLEIATTPPKR